MVITVDGHSGGPENAPSDEDLNPVIHKSMAIIKEFEE